MTDQHTDEVNQPTDRECPACGHDKFVVEQYPADTASVSCSNCGNRCLLVDLRDSGVHPSAANSVDSRWYDGE